MPSTGVKRIKKTKRINALVTVVIDMTLWTLCAKQMALVELHIAGLKAGPTAEGSGLMNLNNLVW